MSWTDASGRWTALFCRFRNAGRRALTSGRLRNRARLHIDILEERLAPASFTVLNNLDSGAGSLRAAAKAANLPANAGSNTITFALGVFGQTIALSSHDTNNPFAFGPTALVIVPGDNLTIAGDPSQAGITISGPGAGFT